MIKRTKKLKAPVPELLVSQCPALTDKLGTNATWATAQTALTNYEDNGFVNEPNRLATAKCQVQGAVLFPAEHTFVCTVPFHLICDWWHAHSIIPLQQIQSPVSWKVI